MGENHKILFLICLEELHSLEAPTSFVFQLQLEGGSKPLVSQVTTRRRLKPLCSLDTTKRWLQPLVLTSSNCPYIEVEWWNHCHTITVRYTIVNLYQSTNNQLVTTCTNKLFQQLPYINLYHKQMHQPCTKFVQLTCHNNMSKQPVINLYHKQVHKPCTNLYQATCNQPVP